MATFTIDLLTGNLYLFTGDFTGSGSTPTSGSTYPQVNVYASLPSAASSSGQVYLVRNGSGTTVLNRKPAGLYYSTGSVWRYLGDTPDAFKSDNFQIIDSTDNTKGLMFQTSGITTGTFPTLTIQNSDGTIAYLSDLNTKVNTSAFNDYTGTTAPNTFVDWTYFNGYSATTLSLINSKQNQLTAGNNISIVGNVISVTGITSVSTNALQLLDTLGLQDINSIPVIPINWGTTAFSGTSLSYTGGSRIYIQESGVFGISYVLNVNGNSNNSDKNIGTLIRKNVNDDITQLSSALFTSNSSNDRGTSTMPENQVSLVSGDYIELFAFRIGYAGSVYTVPNSSWIKVKKV